MTSEKLFEEIQEHIADFTSTWGAEVKCYLRMDSNFQTLPLGERILYAQEIYEQHQELIRLQIPPFTVDVPTLFKQRMQRELDSYANKLESLAKDKSAEIASLKNGKAYAIQEAEAVRSEYVINKLKELEPIMTEHASIPKDRILEIMKMYNISIDDASLDIDKITLNELAEAIKIAKYAASITVEDTKLTDKMLSLFYFPLNKEFADKESEAIFKLGHLTALIILGYLLKPYFFAVVSFVYITHCLSKLYKVMERKDLLSFALSVAEDLDFNKFIENDETYKKLTRDIELAKAANTNLSTQDIEVKYALLLAELSTEDPQQQIDAFQSLYNEHFVEIQEKFNDTDEYMEGEKQRALSCLGQHIKEVEEHFELLKNNMKELGSEISQRRVLDLDFKMGAAYFKNEVVAEATIPIPLENINFLYKNQRSRVAQIEYMKLMLCNALCNVKEKYLQVEIVDPNGLGNEFAEFLTANVDDYPIKMIPQDITSILQRLAEESTATQGVCGSKGIQAFNAENEAIGKLTRDYKLVIVLSSEQQLHQNKKLSSFMKFSNKNGVIIWNLMQEHIQKDSTEDKSVMENYIDFLDGTCKVYEPGVIETAENEQYAPFDLPIMPYTYSMDMGKKVIATLCQSIKDNKIEILPYESVRMRFIPDDKIWTWSTRNGIEIHPGLFEGDPSNFLPHVFGDDTVHALMGGATGQGKSATINQMLAGLLMMYSPEELEMVMIDFKNVEFSMYTGDLLIPHAKIIAGTKDGEYALSVFDYLLGEMRRREKLFSANKVQKLSEYNDLMERLGKKSEILPRILVLIDEFQVMFTEVEPRIVDLIKERITSLSKLARFCGCHMWFTSQSMKNTMSRDILEQFKLRMSLYASKDTSTDLIGNPAASTLKGKGWVYTNDSGAENPKANRLFRVPFCSNDYIKEYLPKLIKKCEVENRLHRRAVFYDEEKVHAGQELIDLYAKHEEFRNDVGSIFLGERTAFSLNPMPFGFRMLRDDGEHILATAIERQSLLNIAQTILCNLDERKVRYFAHTPDRETLKLLDLGNRVEGQFKEHVEAVLSPNDALDIFELFIETNEEELANNPGEEVPEMYFVGINWEKVNGIGVGDDYKIQDRFVGLLRRAGIANVHFVAIVRDATQIAQLLNNFNHRIISKSSSRDSGRILDTDKAEKMKQTLAIYVYNGDQTKFKLYDFPLNGSILERELKLA